MSDSKRTLILGATPNPQRYAYLAAERLVRHGHPIVPVGIKQGSLQGVPIRHGQPEDLGQIDTVTLYVGAAKQAPYYSWLLRSSPKRIIFNPGTENAELRRLAEEAGIETVYGCTLVMLASGQY